MIAAKILSVGLTPKGRRRAAVALGLAVAAVLKRLGRFGHVETRAWRGVPDVADISGEKVDVELGRHVDVEVVDYVVEIFRRKKWDGITVELRGELGRVKLGVDVDIYANEYVPLRAGITNRGVDVLAEPRGHVEGKVIESFYELFDMEQMKMEAFVEELVEVCNTTVKTATYTGVRTYPLWKIVTWMYALRDYDFTPEYTIPLWLKPWVKQLAEYLRAPPNAKKIAEAAALELLEKYYKIKLYEDAMLLIPLSVESHRGAVAQLRSALSAV